MFPLHRRSFLGVGAAAFVGPHLLGEDSPKVSEGVDRRPFVDHVPFQPDTLFLTWFRDPTTTVTVQWVGSEWEVPDRNVYVARLEALPARSATFGTAAANDPKSMVWTEFATKTKPFPLTDRKVFRAEIDNLEPGTEYQFRIGGPRQPTYRFRTMPAKANEEFTFVSGGDCGVNAHAVANNVLAAKQDPYFALIAGDLGYDNGRSPTVMLAFLRNYSKHMIDGRGRLVPLVAGIGNHELNGGFAKDRSAAPLFLSLFDGLYSENTYAALDFGDYLSLVLLDTGHVAKIEGEQTNWLDGALAARSGRPHLIVANHVPAYPSDRPEEGLNGKPGTGEMNRKHWVPLFEKYNVDAVLEHHNHTFKPTHRLKDGTPDPDGIVYLGDGSWGMLRPPKSPEKRPYLARVGEAYHLSLHRLEGERRHHVALEESGRVADVYSSGKKPRHRRVGPNR